MTDPQIDIKRVPGNEREALKRYAQFVVGTPSWRRLFGYEILMALCRNRGGLTGIALRRLFYRHVFRTMGRDAIIGHNVTLRGGDRIVLGDGVRIDDNCVLDARGPNAAIHIGSHVIVSRNTVIRARNAPLHIDDSADIGCNCLLATDCMLHVGRQVLIGAYTYLCAGGNHRFDGPETCILEQGCAPGNGIRIGDGAWLGARVTVLDGTTVGAGTVVGAHALVTHDLPDRCVAYGSPATVQRQRA